MDQIWEGGQKDKISFTTLNKQIESAIKKGYSEYKIIKTVFKAVSPGIHLRYLLEVKRDHLKRTLQSCLIIRPAAQAHEHFPRPNKSAQTFLFRAIELIEKLLC